MAIVMHAARATHDWLRAGVRRDERIYHVLSDQLGSDGAYELRAFVEQLGLPARFVQYPGTYREHFDAPGRYRDQLIQLGARSVTTHELGHLLRRKREAADDQPSSIEG